MALENFGHTSEDAKPVRLRVRMEIAYGPAAQKRRSDALHLAFKPKHPHLASLVDELNARFAAGRPSDTLRSAGILIHQFDGRDDPNPDGTPWMPQRNDASSISAAVVNKALEPEQDQGAGDRATRRRR